MVSTDIDSRFQFSAKEAADAFTGTFLGSPSRGPGLTALG